MPTKEYPRPGELVIATVKNIFGQGAFVTLDEYGGKRGLLHISEMSLKWVRNIRDYVKEGQKVVLMALNVKPERGHIDLSLRRVSDYQKKLKLKEVKEKQRADKLLELLGKELKLSSTDLEKISQEILKKYKSIYEGLEDISLHEVAVNKLELPQKWKSSLLPLVKKNIKPALVEIDGYVKLESYEPNGVETIKKALQIIADYPLQEGVEKIEVGYISAPNYRVKVKAKDYKIAERTLKDSAEKSIEYIKKHKGQGEFYRELKELKE